MPDISRLRAVAAALLMLIPAGPGLLRAQDLLSSRDAFARALVASANRADTAAVRTELASRFPADLARPLAEAVRVFTRLHAQGGTLDVVKVAPSGANNTFVTLQAATVPRRALVNFGWSRTDSAKLRYVEVLKVWDPAVEQVAWTPAHSLTEIVATIDRNASELQRLGAYSGTVLVAKGDSVILARGYGWANLEDSVRNGPATHFHIASMGKMFTAVAIGQLIEAGRLRLDDTLASVLPEYPNQERARQITIRQLLTHTAGLGDLWSHPNYGKGGPYDTNRQLAWAVSSGPTLFPPGSKWSYSNEGFAVLGAVIEQLSGERFEDYLREHVWGPAGMTGMMIAGGDRTVPHRAFGFMPADDDVLGVRELRSTMSRLGRTSAAQGAGGEYATATDMLRFAQALRGGKLLSTAMRDTLWTGVSPLPWDSTTRYASGFERHSIAGEEFVGHGGGGGFGIDNMFFFSVRGPWTVVVLGNYNPPGATNVAAAIGRFLAESEPLIAPR